MAPIEKDPSAGLNAAVAATLNGERAALGLTFDELAERSGISKSTLLRLLGSNKEKRRHIDVAYLYALAEALSLTPSEVVEAAESRMVRMDVAWPKSGESPVVELKPRSDREYPETVDEAARDEDQDS